MVILVTDTGFHPDDWRDGFVPLAAVSPQVGATIGRLAVDLAEAAIRVTQTMLPVTAPPSDALNGNGRRGGWGGRRRVRRVRVWSGRWRR